MQCRLSLHVHCMSLRRYRQFSREQPRVALIQIMLAIDVMVQFRTSEPAQNDQFCQILSNLYNAKIVIYTVVLRCR